VANSEPDEQRVLGQLLGDARQAAGLSQPAVARQLGVSQSRIAQLELGRRRLMLTEAFRLAELYGISLEDLDPRGKRLPDQAPARRVRVDRRRDQEANSLRLSR
jgi:transcriptional regulator with XRE-family HTH domain